MAAERGGTIRAIALTHVDPDHAAGAEAVAEQLAIEVVVGPGGGRPLPYAVRELADGEVVDAGDVPLRVVATPGPRPDHLAFVIGDGQIVLSGDLDGRRGAHAMPGPGDEAAWAASRSRLDSFAPDSMRFGGHPAGT